MNMKNTISILIVGLWVFVNISILAIIVFSLLPVDQGVILLKDFNVVIAGPVGVVIGHFFTGS